MQGTESGTQFAQFWRKCAQLQATGASQIMEESLRITRTILKTQAEVVDAAGQYLSERQREMQENIEQAGREGVEAMREAAANGSHALQQAQRAGQPAKSSAHRATS